MDKNEIKIKCAKFANSNSISSDDYYGIAKKTKEDGNLEDFASGVYNKNIQNNSLKTLQQIG